MGSFIIFNAFKITVAQRTRQLGLIRAVGASGSQVVLPGSLEAALIGLVASVIGIMFGIAFAALLRCGFNALGAGLPATTLQVEPRSLIAGLVVGMLVTFVSALLPAWKASRVPPIAAMHDVQIEGSPRGRLVVSVVLTALGVGLVLAGLLASLDGLAQRFTLIGLGAVLLFIGAAMLTQYVARPLARVIGAPMAKLGLAGRLGQENAMRNPSRTAQTAAALTIGVALVTGVSVFAASLNETFIGTLDKRVRADLIIFRAPRRPFSPAAGLRPRGHVRAVGGHRLARRPVQGRRRRHAERVRADPTQLDAVYDPGVTEGSMTALSEAGTIAVQEDYAKDHDLGVGSTLPALFSRTGPTDLRVVAIYTDETFGRFFVSLDEYERNFTTQQDTVILARAADGVTPEAAKAAAEADLEAFPNLDVRTKAEYKDFVASQINDFLALFYLLLAMAVIIAIFGIVLTLALSVFERTREIGSPARGGALASQRPRDDPLGGDHRSRLIGGLVGLVLGVFLAGERLGDPGVQRPGRSRWV